MTNEVLHSVQDKITNWWNFGDQKNPCIIASMLKKNSTVPDTEDMKKFWTDIDFRVDRSIKTVEQTNYYCQSVPYHWLDYAASSMVIALGCEVNYLNKETVWAYPIYDGLEEILDLELDEKSYHYGILLEMNRKLASLNRKNEYICPFALEGLTDIISGLYGTENFLMDLVSKPNEVKKVMEHFKRVWINAFNNFNKIISVCGNAGSVNWSGLWAPGTTFLLQEDTSYMLSTELFQKFCLKHIYDFVDAVDFPIYHLDGKGAIVHLDCLLEIPKLKAIQWVPGAGNERLCQWYELINHIISKGKSVQVFAEMNEIEELVNNVGAKGLQIVIPEISHEQAEQLMHKFGDC
jgi:hypothetical protein